MARFARSRQLVTLFKQTTTPTDAQGATIGDIWSKTDDNTMYVCNAVAPATFTQIGAGGGGGGSPGGSNTYVQYNDSGSFGGDSGLVYNKSTHVLTISGHFAGAITGNVTGTVSGNAGTVTNGVYTTDTGTVTNTMLAGSIANGKLANAAVANLSGTNTGDQTITLTGNVTGSGTGSFATTIGAGVVTNAMLAGSIAASKISGTAATGGGTCSGTCTGSNSGDQTNISGNAATVTTNANLTGVITSTGNATIFATMTANNVLLGNGTSTPQVVAPSTSGNVLTSNGTTWTSAAPAGGGGGALNLIQTIGSYSSSRTYIDFISITGYAHYLITFDQVFADGGGGEDLTLLISDDGGSTWQTGTFAYNTVLTNCSGTSISVSTSGTNTAGVISTACMGTDGHHKANGTIQIHGLNQSGTGYVFMDVNITGRPSSNVRHIERNLIEATADKNYNSIRIYNTGSDIFGKFSLYGYST